MTRTTHPGQIGLINTHDLLNGFVLTYNAFSEFRVANLCALSALFGVQQAIPHGLTPPDLGLTRNRDARSCTKSQLCLWQPHSMGCNSDYLPQPDSYNSDVHTSAGC